MEGYTNLSLIKEEDFNKHGVGHLHAKNATKRVYQTSRKAAHSSAHHGSFSKGRKASEATTAGQSSSLPGTRKQYSSVENRFNTPLRLPNLRTPGSKKNSTGTQNTIKQHSSNLATVIESQYNGGKPGGAGKLCHICAKKHKAGHAHFQQAAQNQQSTGVKGAPYYQPMSLNKPPQGSKVSLGLQGRSNSNGRTKPIARNLRGVPPKWLNKEYKPVFRMPSGDKHQASRTIEPEPASHLDMAHLPNSKAEQHLPLSKSVQKSPMLESSTISPRSE